ncbi:hypothetical protein EDB81DRAFT_804746 [Dactylonectria macrodidyma]|uniref:Uncharacterized protein n=1 Tax=Dactylonectria macrodidyma TaxID=307937 RepID=A0A9P9E9Y3_9HYPO|nr:hypothetical protein EDB81DRAFT_804746 [Dactylonectria macrodidyma]
MYYARSAACTSVRAALHTRITHKHSTQFSLASRARYSGQWHGKPAITRASRCIRASYALASTRVLAQSSWATPSGHNNNNTKTLEAPCSKHRTRTRGSRAPKGGVRNCAPLVCLTQPHSLFFSRTSYVTLSLLSSVENANATAGGETHTEQINATAGKEFPRGGEGERKGRSKNTPPPSALQRPAVTEPGCSGKSPRARPCASRGWCQRMDAGKGQQPSLGLLRPGRRVVFCRASFVSEQFLQDGALSFASRWAGTLPSVFPFPGDEEGGEGPWIDDLAV